MPIPGLQGLWELELASGQLPETSFQPMYCTVKVPGRSTHLPGIGYYDRDHHNNHHPLPPIRKI